MREEDGFGLVTVMIGAVVLGIFALVYTQQMQNRANVSLIGDLMAFREQVMTYYSSVVGNRSTWECTIQDNSDLKFYLATGHKDTTYSDPSLDAGKRGSYEALKIKDYDGDCQEGFGGIDGDVIVPAGGLGLELDKDHSDLPVDPYRDCDDSASGTHFCLEVGWKRLDPDQSTQRAVEVRLILKANRKAIKDKFNVSFDLADKKRYLYFNRTVATDCSDGRITGYFPGTARGTARPFNSFTGIADASPHTTSKGVPAYAGDAAVVKLDSITGMVACSSVGPLVVPSCYDMSDYEYIGTAGDHPTLRKIYRNPFISGGAARGGSGMPGFRGFQSTEGFTNIQGKLGLQCDGSGDCCSLPSFGASCSSDASCVPGTARTAVKGRCPETDGSGTTAIAYFDPQTGISQCSNPNILVEKTEGAAVAEVCEDADNWYGVVLIRGKDMGTKKVGTFQCSKDYWSSGGTPDKRGGVEPDNTSYPCTVGQEAIAYFEDEGYVSDPCVKGQGAQTDAPIGFPGPKGERGDSYPGPAGPRAVSVCPSGYSECPSPSNPADPLACNRPGLSQKTGNRCEP